MMRTAISLLLVALCAIDAHAQSVTGVSMAGVAFNMPETAVSDCRSQALALYDLDENSTAQRANTGTCGSACDLTASGAIPNSTLIYQEPTASMDCGITETDYLSCSDATCGAALDRDGVSDRSLTWGCRLRKESTLFNNIVLDKMGSTNTGFLLSTPGETVQCSVENKSLSVEVVLASGQWALAACRFDDAANQLTAFVNGTTMNCSDCPTTMSGNSVQFAIGYDNDQGLSACYGYHDECAILQGARSSAFLCFWCSCLLDGSLCKRIGNVWSSVGLNDTQCDSCTLPADPSNACTS